MLRVPKQSVLFRSFAIATTGKTPPGRHAPRANDLRVETLPRPIGDLVKYIKKEDVVREMANGYRLIRARRDHIPMLRDSMADFVLSEPTDQGAGMTKAPDELIWPFLFNVTRYPFSFFGLNKENEIIGMLLADLVEKDPKRAALPRLELNLKNPKEPFHLVARLIDWSEQEHLRILNVNEVLHGEVVYTPSVLRRNKLSNMMFLAAMSEAVRTVSAHGIRYVVGVATGEANKGNLLNIGFKMGGQIPREMYVDFDGKPWLPNGEEPGTLCHFDMVDAHEKKVFDSLKK